MNESYTEGKQGTVDNLPYFPVRTRSPQINNDSDNGIHSQLSSFTTLRNTNGKGGKVTKIFSSTKSFIFWKNNVFFYKFIAVPRHIF